MTTTLRAPPAPAPSRAAQRKQRLLELENEQRLEDAEALKFTEVRSVSRWPPAFLGCGMVDRDGY
jgi:hypothetical protein